MTSHGRVTVVAGDDIAAVVRALGIEISDDAPVALVDLRASDALPRAATLPADRVRVFVADDAQRPLLHALAVDADRIVDRVDPALIGPLVLRHMPRPETRRSRIVVVAATRGGVGRTLLVTNLARRLARRLRVLVLDATGTGAAAWWLRREPRSWTELEGIAGEITSEQLALLADDGADGPQVLGDVGAMPSASVLLETARCATGLADLVLVDAPALFDARCAALRETCDRFIVVTYDEPLAIATLAGLGLTEREWVVGSQTRAERIGSTVVFRALPRDERSVASAVADRGPVGGALGRAYDDLALLLGVDARDD